MIVVGVLAVLHPDRLTDQLNLFTDPSAVDIVYASVVAMLAYAGIEAASDLAPDIDVHPRDLKRIVSVGAFAVPLVYAGMAAVALMAVPVVAGPDGPHTALGGEFVEAPVLGVVSAFHPARGRRSDALGRRPGRGAGPLLGGDDGDARRLPPHLHAGDQPPDPELARQAQLAPRDAAGRDRDLGGDRDRPGRADQRQAAGRDLRLRRDPGDHDRPPLDPAPADHRTRPRAALPGALERQLARRARCRVPAIFAAVLSGLAFLSVLAFHDTARWVGGGWMAFGLLFYVVYRKVFEGTTLTRRVSVTEKALTKQVPDLAYRNILVPIFGSKLDDDIVSTAGRLAAAEQEAADGDVADARLDLVYVVEVPLTLPLDAKLPPEREKEAQARARAGQRGRRRVRGRRGQRRDGPRPRRRRRDRRGGAAHAPPRRSSSAPSRRARSGAGPGSAGIGAARPAEIGAATEYVLKKAPCRVLLTAPPEASARARTRPPR